MERGEIDQSCVRLRAEDAGAAEREAVYSAEDGDFLMRSVDRAGALDMQSFRVDSSWK